MDCPSRQMENTDYEVVSFIKDVDYQCVNDDLWHHGTAQLVSGAIEGKPNIVVAYGFEEGKEEASAITKMTKREKGDEYIFDVNNMWLDDDGVHIPRIKLKLLGD